MNTQLRIRSLLILFFGLILFAAITLAKEKKSSKITEIITSEEIILEGILNNKSAELATKYKQSATTGDSDSAFMLALLYKKSNELSQCEILRGKKNVTQKKIEGEECSKTLNDLYLKWVKTAAKKRHPLALFEMALIHDKRNAIKYNQYKRLSKRSLYWVKKAAEKGERRAIGFLAEYDRIIPE